jgi:hypothetical protein
MAPAWLFPSMSPKLPVRSCPWLPDISFHLAPLDIVAVYFIERHSATRQDLPDLPDLSGLSDQSDLSACICGICGICGICDHDDPAATR